MAEDLIRYDVLVQEAMRSVIRKVLVEVARAGLPGEHHFYIAFDTRAPGVRISTRLRERYPDEITIVLQHQFWDLIVAETYFEVGLAFGGVPERLVVPFTAIKAFFDPSVEFGTQFEVEREAESDVKVEDRMPEADEPASVRLVVPGASASVPQPLDAEASNVKSVAAASSVVSLDAFRKKT